LLTAPTPEDQAVRAEGCRIDVISSDHELRAVLAEACSAAGFEPRTAPDLDLGTRPWDGAGDGAPAGPDLTLWDVPVLEPDWPDRLERRSRMGPVIALLGFPDRGAVGLAKARGASACLELPFAVDDLIHALDRVVEGARREQSAASPSRSELAHAVPPPPLGPKAPRGREAIRRRAGWQPPWPDDESGPRMTSGRVD
jgi:DNA-binding NtrC family response regulator